MGLVTDEVMCQGVWGIIIVIRETEEDTQRVLCHGPIFTTTSINRVRKKLCVYFLQSHFYR